MTRKDYLQFADLLVRMHKNFAGAEWPAETILNYLAGELIEIVARDNPRFDRESFECFVRTNSGS